MGSASKYWQLVKLDSTGERRIEVIISAKTYFQQQFPEWNEQAEVSDALIQRQLWQLRQNEKISTQNHFLAESCLRCYISHQIERTCRDLGTKFGSRNGFTYEDMLPYVLDDVGRSLNWVQSHSYQSLATTILQTFNPAKGSLNTWIMHHVNQQPELKRFLLQHGIYLASDWAILNDTTPKQLQRILTEMYHLTPIEVQQSCELLQSFHAVYREDRLQQRLAGVQERCQIPTPDQLVRMANVSPQTNYTLNIEIILSQLQVIATKLRRYRISARGGSVPAVSVDQPEMQPMIERLQSSQDDEEHIEFLKFYQKQFLYCLDQAISQVISNFISKLQRKHSASAQSFLTALDLFHCQGQSMSDIAPQIGFKK